MSQQNTPQEEEVDLGQLFKLIGNMFSNFFNFIGNIFKGAFHFLIRVLVHFYSGLKWYIAAIIIGVVIGYILDNKSDDVYGANLFIETNFDSARQVYENIQNLNQLAEVDQDSTELHNILGISIKQAATLKGFYIEPDLDENTMVNMFSEYRQQLDSVSNSEANYESYKVNLAFYNFDIHKISIVSTDKSIYSSLKGKLAAYISKNSYMEKVRDATLNNLEQEAIVLEKQTIELDSLAKEYFKIRVAESQKEPIPGAGTNLFLAGGDDQNNLIVDETELIDKKYDLEIRKRQIIKEQVKQEDIINVIADFPSSGYDISKPTGKMKFVLPVALFTLTFLISLFILLMGYLKEQNVLLNEKKN